MDEAQHALPFVEEALLFLAATVVAVLVMHRLRIGPVLGYLAAGVAIGPSGFGLIEAVDEIRAVAELGVVLLLFVIGLELSVERLRALRRLIFGLGAAQVIITSAVLAAIALALGQPLAAAIVLGGALALSSTAMVVQLLVERGEVAGPTGRHSFAILLFQDLAVVPLLLLVGVLAGPAEQSLPITLLLALAKAAAAVVLILVIGRWVLTPLLRHVAGTRSTELFTATALLIVLGTGWATAVGGLSAALGAFLAGLVLAGTEFRHQIESDIQPFKGLLLGLFFLAVGMGIDLALIADQALWVATAVVGLIVIKALIAGGLARLFGAPPAVALRTGLLLGEGGEFAFVVIGAAVAATLVEGTFAQLVYAVVGLSILVTPLLRLLGDVLAARLPSAVAAESPAEESEQPLDGHVVIAGFGRVGQTVAQLFTEQQVPYIAVDLGADLVREFRQKGWRVLYGDGSKPEVLRQLGADRAAAIIVTLDTPTAAARTVEVVRHHFPHLKIFARSRDRFHAGELLAQGAAAVVPETFESSLTLARGALESMGVPTAAVDELLAKHREGAMPSARRAAPATAPTPAPLPPAP